MKNAEQIFAEMTPFEKEKLLKEQKQSHMEWLRFIIKDKEQSIEEFFGKEKQVRILRNEKRKYENELNLLIGFTPEPTEFDDMSSEMLELHDKLYKKQAVMISSKKDKNIFEKVSLEVKSILDEIEKLKQIEENGKNESRSPYKDESEPF